MDDQVKKILIAYRDSVINIKEALRVANIPEPLIEIYTINFPDFNKLLPDDVVSLFRDIRTITIMYLDFHGLSLREIAKRVGCSHTVVQDIINKNKVKPDTVGVNEVSQTPKSLEVNEKERDENGNSNNGSTA